MAQRLVSLSPNPMIVTSSQSKLLSSLSKYVKPDFMNLVLEENASLANARIIDSYDCPANLNNGHFYMYTKYIYTTEDTK